MSMSLYVCTSVSARIAYHKKRRVEIFFAGAGAHYPLTRPIDAARDTGSVYRAPAITACQRSLVYTREHGPCRHVYSVYRT